MWTVLVALAHAGPCNPDTRELEEALGSVPQEVAAELSAMWLSEACAGRAGLASGARSIAASPPDYRPLLDLKVIAEEPGLWMKACPGGLAVPQQMAQVAPSEKRRVIWEGCELASRDWFTREEWEAADGLVGIALVGAQALADSGAKEAAVRAAVRGLAGISSGRAPRQDDLLRFQPPPMLEPVEVFEPYEGRAPDPAMDLGDGGALLGGGLGGGAIGGYTEIDEDLLSGAALGSVLDGGAGFVARPEVRWTGAAKRSPARVCKVEVTVRKSGAFGRVEWLDCPDVLRKPVEKALEGAHYTVAVEGGEPVRGTFKTRFTVRR